MKRKFLYFITALMLSLTLSVGGIGNTYIQAKASSGILDPLWNTDVSAWENIGQYASLFAFAIGAYIEPTIQGEMFAIGKAAEFVDFMISDGYSEEEANEVVHGGGGFVRDGITRDSDGNVTYSDEVSDLFYKYICNYLEVESGYWVVETMAADEVPRDWFESDELHRYFIDTVKQFYLLGVTLCMDPPNGVNKNVWFYKIDRTGTSSLQTYFVLSPGYTEFSPEVPLLNINHSSTSGPAFSEKFSAYGYSYSEYQELVNYLRHGTIGYSVLYSTDKYPEQPAHVLKVDKYSQGHIDYRFIVSANGSLIKVFKDLAAFEKYRMKEQLYYVNNTWTSYNISQDNSTTISNSEYQYYTDNSSTVYNNVQNIVNNSGSDLTEDDIQRIVEDELKKFKDNMKEEEKEDDNTVPGDDSGNGSGGGGSVSGNGTGGTGIGDFVGGLGSLLDFILSLLGKVIGLISDFLNSALELLGNLTSFTDGFSSFLTAAFGFLPEEAVTLICSGIALLITLGIIKYMRN